jgi:uncharacterized membrane protein
MDQPERTATEMSPIEEHGYDVIITIMTWGFRLAFGILGIGLLLAAARREGLSTKVEPIGDVVSGVLHGKAAAFVDLGIIILLLTPPTVIATTIILFLRRRDFLYAGISSIVFITLLVGITLAFV